MNKSEKIVELYNNNKDWSNRKIAEKLGTSKRHVRRILNPIRDKSISKLPKILILDIETAPCLSTVWGIFKQRIPLENIQKEWFVISWSGKYLFDSNIMSDVLTPDEAKEGDDKRILRSIWKIIDESDILVGHNLRRFDIRRLNARFIINGLDPPSSYQTIDTLTECKKHFAFTGYKLDYINQILGLDRKDDTSYKLWLGCINGDEHSLKEMQRYNKQDVVITEELYIKIRGWLKSHPNIALFTNLETLVCPSCGSENLKESGRYHTPAGRFKSYRCECGAISRSRYSDLTKEERHNLLISVAR